MKVINHFSTTFPVAENEACYSICYFSIILYWNGLYLQLARYFWSHITSLKLILYMYTTNFSLQNTIDMAYMVSKLFLFYYIFYFTVHGLTNWKRLRMGRRDEALGRARAAISARPQAESGQRRSEAAGRPERRSYVNNNIYSILQIQVWCLYW